jgi:DNA-binding MarR family transcriptional regulator
VDEDVIARLRAVINRLSRQFNASATDEGLTPSQASALGLIHRQGAMSLADLTRIESLNPTMVSRIVGHLVSMGLIERVPHPEDQRAVVVHTTPAGDAAQERIREQRRHVVGELLSHLAEPDRESIAAALPALEALADDLSGRG